MQPIEPCRIELTQCGAHQKPQRQLWEASSSCLATLPALIHVKTNGSNCGQAFAELGYRDENAVRRSYRCGLHHNFSIWSDRSCRRAMHARYPRAGANREPSFRASHCGSGCAADVSTNSRSDMEVDCRRYCGQYRPFAADVSQISRRAAYIVSALRQSPSNAQSFGWERRRSDGAVGAIIPERFHTGRACFRILLSAVTRQDWGDEGGCVRSLRMDHHGAGILPDHRPRLLCPRCRARHFAGIVLSDDAAQLQHRHGHCLQCALRQGRKDRLQHW